MHTSHICSATTSAMAVSSPYIEPSYPRNSAQAASARAAADDIHARLVALRHATQKLSSESMTSEQRLAALEQLRLQAIELLPQQRRHYIARPLPLTEDECRAWEAQIALWQALYFGFALCTDVTGDVAISASVWARALDSLGHAIREHGWAYRAVPPTLWKELNSCYRSAEACGLDAVPVRVAEHATQTHTCASVFLTTLLHDAANSYAFSAAQMSAVEHWLPGWLQHTRLLRTPPANGARSPLAVDLSSSTGARLARDLPPSDQLRYLDTGALGSKLREIALALRENTPTREIGDILPHLPLAAIERLLTNLYVQWCSTGTGRIEERREAAVRAQVAVTMHAVHFQISGRAFRQPGLRYTREEEHDLATFGHITERTEHRLLTGRSSAQEPWEVVNQSSSGSLGMCRKPDLSSRIGHGQLVAIRTSSTHQPMLGTVQRLRTEADGALSAGVRLIRADARGVAVRAPNTPSTQYERALILDSDEDRKLPATLIVPPGQFLPGAVIEMYASRAEQVRLGAIIERGFDFERLVFERL